MVVTLDTLHLEMSPLNDVAPPNMLCMLVTFNTFQFEMSPLNAELKPNIEVMVVTLDTSHFERSPSNLSAPGTSVASNKLSISVTADTSQDPIGPCGPLEQSVGDSFRHSTTAAWRSALDFGAHAPVVGYQRLR